MRDDATILPNHRRRLRLVCAKQDDPYLVLPSIGTRTCSAAPCIGTNSRVKPGSSPRPSASVLVCQANATSVSPTSALESSRSSPEAASTSTASVPAINGSGSRPRPNCS